MSSSTVNNCRGRVEKYFSFLASSPTQIDAMRDMLTDSIDNGHYILIYTGVHGNFDDTTIWKNSHFQSIEDLGADSIRHVPTKHPYIFFAKKGFPNTAVEKVGQSTKDVIELVATMQNNGTYGAITSTEIGPAQNWETLSWVFNGVDHLEDSITLSVIGITSSGNESTMMSFQTLKSDSFDLSSIDAINPIAPLSWIKIKFSLVLALVLCISPE